MNHTAIPMRAGHRAHHLRMTARALLLCLGALASAAHGKDHVIVVGGTAITVPVDDGFVRASERGPSAFEMAASALPPTARLVEMFHTPDNLSRILQGGTAQGHFLMIQVMREIEPMVLNDADWAEAIPHITAGMATADLSDKPEEQAARDARMSGVAGQDVAMRFGQIDKPEIYHSSGNSVRFVMRIPVVIQSEEGQVEMNVGAAGGIVRVRGKLLFVYWYANPASPGSVVAAQARLADTIAAMTAANDGTAAAAPAPRPTATPAGKASVEKGGGR